ncbi:MAG: excinuclease ABC subunit UvrA [Candidatus Desulfofervidaceae bacterium]|nr:excinuclease ABC subunit UvrA [Candidatus Desulfofervidaceae bacterium]
MPYITLHGAREHNLKNISLNIPRDKLVVITGVSGSGKTTLAFDILFAEGQRRYIETLPAYVRQYLQVLAKPDIDLLTGIPPTVAINQRSSLFTRRSTVATITEIAHYLRLFFAKAGRQYCPKCGRSVQSMQSGEILDAILSEWKGEEIAILAPKVRQRKGWHKEVFKEAVKKGYTEARVNGKIVTLGQNPPALARYKEHNIDIVIARLHVNYKNLPLLREAVNLGLKEGRGVVTVINKSTERLYSEKLFCPFCQMGLPSPDPRLFSFNSPLGACPRCDGLGTIGDKICPQCQGHRLNSIALAVRIADYNIADIQAQSVETLLKLLPNLPLDERQREIAKPIIPEIFKRLSFLNQVGLGYLTLDRSGDTLSGGEAQRIRLAAQLGSNLRGVCYILDEPTIGLHPRDNAMLIEVLKTLRDRGNTVLVVEHDAATIKAADFVIDLGPGAGKEGGRVIATGTPAEIKANPHSLTGEYLKRGLKLNTSPVKMARWLHIKGARAFNLKGFDVAIPLGTFTCVTGVSGSGKSSLVMEVVYKGLKARLQKVTPPDNHVDMIGWEAIKRVLVVDHSPIGRTPRSTPATYVGVWDEIRHLFAQVPAARAKGYKPGRFSFNVRGGRCEHCAGQGKIKVEMNFLPDVYVDCEVCNGKRFNEETLAITYKGKNIAEVLNMTIAEAAAFFSAIPRISHPLKILEEMGLGYLTLGQPSHTLSGGEAQRIKLTEELCKKSQGKTLYILDEPSTGLHMADVEKLIKVLRKLVEVGNTVLVIEHNLDIIAAADYIIDLGPEGGEKGGELVASGSPGEIIHCPRSYTGQWLKLGCGNGNA